MLFFVFLFENILSASPIYKNSFNKASFLQINQSKCFYDHHYTNRSFFYCTVCFIGCTFESIQTNSEGGAISLLIQTPFTTKNYFENCTFSHCTSEEGGAIYMKFEKKCETEIKNCTFTKCTADISGGSISFLIRNEQYNAYIINCTFDQNTASKKTGGSIRASSNPISDFKFQNCSFNFNKALNGGGAIFLYTLKASFDNCIFYNNTANIEGGSILSYYSICSYFMCFFDKNEATKLKNPNSNDDKDFSYGGAISINFGTNSHDNNATFNNCNFTNNVVHSDIKNCVGCGGAVSLLEAESFITKCNFINNKVDSYESNGGAVKFGCLYGIISECNFVNNTACLGKGQGDGGAIEVKENDFYYVNYIIKKQNNVTIKQCSFINNKIESNKYFSGGGAVSFKHLFAIFIENNFVNNSVYTNRGSQGGAVYFKDVYGQIDCCNFTFNRVEINGSSIFNYEEPVSFGGAFYMTISRSYFNKCLFVNNTGSNVGGAVYSSSAAKFTACSFINNSVTNYLSKSDLNTTIRGGACYFASSTELIDNYFINNTVTVRLCENSSHINVNAYGGAVYARYSYIVCSNCSFLGNLVSVPNNHQNEFAGAIELHKGKIENCTFIDNVAYNGCDIRYNQLSLFKGYSVYNIYSNVSINNNFFLHHSLEDHDINSIIYIDVNSTHNPINTFVNNKVILYKSTVLFDGKIVENKNPNPFITVHFIPRFKFNNNCIAPINQKLFISDDFFVYNEVENKNVTFEFAFVSNCDGYETQIPKTQTQIPKTQTQTQMPKTQISNNDNNDNTDIETRMFNKIYSLLIVITVFQIIVVIIILFVIFLLRRRDDRDDIDPLIA